MKTISQKRKRWGTWAQYKKICLEIWEERGKMCEKCPTYITEPKTYNFNHTAGRRENFLNKLTIQLLCFRCHSKYHGIKALNAEWLN